MEEVKEEVKKCPVPIWKRAGYIGFWFFFFKGIAWIVMAVLVWIWGPDFFTNVKDFFLNLI